MQIGLWLLNYLYIALVLLWDPIQIGILSFDGAGRSVVMLTFLMLALNVAYDRRFLSSYVLKRPVAIWGLWVIYSIFNQIIEGYYYNTAFFMYVAHHLIKPFFVMILVIKETLRNSIRTLWFLTGVFSTYTILSVTLLHGGSDPNSDRLLGDLGNMGPLNSIYVVAFASLLYVHNRMGLFSLAGLIGLSLFVSASAGTRKAFSAVAVVVGHVYISRFRLSFVRITSALIVLAVLLLAGDYILESTPLGERFEEGAEVGEEMNTTGVEALSLLGDRALQYIKGWEVFKDNPINGIGLKNFYYKGHGELVLHSEYLVQLVEGGILGTVIFCMFHYCLAKGLSKICLDPKSRSVGLVLLGIYLATLSVGLTAWLYQFPFYFAVFGVIIAYIQLYNSNHVHDEFLAKFQPRYT